MPDEAWTVGTGHRSLAELLALLALAEIELLVDVRSFPKSHLPHFSRPRLEEGLAESGLGYAWLGDELGGLRQRGYEDHMRSAAFSRGLQRLEALARRHRAALCCAEVEPERCHRRFISDALVARGWRVVHLVRPGELREHRRLPRQDLLPLDDHA